jgi:hypothetical protein
MVTAFDKILFAPAVEFLNSCFVLMMSEGARKSLGGAARFFEVARGVPSVA